VGHPAALGKDCARQNLGGRRILSEASGWAPAPIGAWKAEASSLFPDLPAILLGTSREITMFSSEASIVIGGAE
jgi:hypothetical protein